MSDHGLTQEPRAFLRSRTNELRFLYAWSARRIFDTLPFTHVPILTNSIRMAQKSKRTIKNPAAVALAKLGASKGGKARAQKLSARERTRIARLAVETRWKRYRAEK